MRKFHAVGTDDKGRKYAGTFEAGSEAEARRMLASEGYTILTLEELSSEDLDSEAAEKRVSLRSPEKKDEPSAGRAYAGGASRKSSGTGAALAAAGLALAVLLAVMGYLSLKKEDPLFTQPENRLPVSNKAAFDSAPEGKTQGRWNDDRAEEESLITAVEAEAAEVRVYEAADESTGN